MTTSMMNPETKVSVELTLDQLRYIAGLLLAESVSGRDESVELALMAADLQLQLDKIERKLLGIE